MSVAKRRALLGVVVVLALVAVFLLTKGETSPAPEAGNATQAHPSLPPDLGPLRLALTPEDAAKDVDPTDPVRGTVHRGRFTAVTLTKTGSDQHVPCSFNESHSEFHSQEGQESDSRYRLDYTIERENGASEKGSRSWQTGSADQGGGSGTVRVTSFVKEGATVGVGQPIQLDFSAPIRHKDRVRSKVHVLSSSAQEAHCRWFGDIQLRCRPESFWDAHSQVKVKVALSGVNTGDQRGAADSEFVMNIGDKQILRADAEAKTATLSINDEVERTMPAMLGRPSFPTPAGYLVVMNKAAKTQFNAASIGLKPGDPDDYGSVEVHYAMRTSASGYYIHEALADVRGKVGQENLTHGCVGLRTEDARAVFDLMLVGSVVEDVNAPGSAIDIDDGFGDWNLSWEQWREA